MTSIKAGVIGTGMMGRVHADAIRRCGASVGAIAGSSAARTVESAAAWVQDADIRTADEIIADPSIDVVHICVPNSLHHRLALEAIDAGKHVVCEKPLGTTVRESTELAERARAAGVVATVPFVYRYHPLVIEAHVRVKAGTAGRVHLMHGSYLQDWLSSSDDDNWRVDSAASGESRAFADIGSHWCDLVEWVSGERITAVSATTSTVYDRRGQDATRVVDTEDIACVNLRFANGAIGSLVVSQVSPGRKNRLLFELSGSLASVSFDQENPESMWWATTAGTEAVIRDPRSLSAAAAAASTLPAGHPMGYNDCFHAFVADTYRAIDRAGSHALPTFDDGLRTTVITRAVLDAARSGRWVALPNDYLTASAEAAPAPQIEEPAFIR